MKALYFLALLAFVACGEAVDQQADTADTEQTPVDPKADWVSTDLSNEDFPLTVSTPPGTTPSVLWREEFGHLEVRAGDKFGLIISEEIGEIQRRKADLERDLIQTHTFVTDEPGRLVYRSEFPESDNLVFVHLYELLEVGDRSFVVSDIQDGKFSEADIEKMSGAVVPKAGS